MPSELTLEKALKKKPAKFLTPKLAHAEPDDAVFADARAWARTNKTSSKPIIGIHAITACTGVIAYNKKTKVAAVEHDLSVGNFGSRMIVDAVSRVRGEGSTDSVELHIFGMKAEGMAESTRQFARDIVLPAMIDTLNTLSNVDLKTFDVLDKAFPRSFAIDARNGKLISYEGLKSASTSFPGIIASQVVDKSGNPVGDLLSSGMSFDGTMPQHQRARKSGRG